MYEQRENINPTSITISKRAGRWIVSSSGEGRFKHIRAFRRLDALRLESGTTTTFRTGFKNVVSDITVEADSVLGYLTIEEQMIDDVNYVVVRGTSERFTVL